MNLRLITYVTVALFTGFQLGSLYEVRNLIPLATAPENPVILQAAEIITDVNRAASTLANCAAFRAKYGSKLPELVHFGTIHFAYGSIKSKWFKDSYAMVPFGTRTIVLTDYFFDLNSQDRQAVLGHELMHIIGVQSSWLHNTTYVTAANDDVYRLMYTCFESSFND